MAPTSKTLALLAGCAAIVGFGICVNLKAEEPTLPSAHHGGRDDIQYFPSVSPEERLANMKRALEQYQLEKQDAL